MMSRFWRKLNHIQWNTQHRIFTQRINSRYIGTPGIDVLKNSKHFIVVVMFKLKLLCPRQGNQDQNDRKSSDDHSYQLMNDRVIGVLRVRSLADSARRLWRRLRRFFCYDVANGIDSGFWKITNIHVSELLTIKNMLVS